MTDEQRIAQVWTLKKWADALKTLRDADVTVGDAAALLAQKTINDFTALLAERDAEIKGWARHAQDLESLIEAKRAEIASLKAQLAECKTMRVIRTTDFVIDSGDGEAANDE